MKNIIFPYPVKDTPCSRIDREGRLCIRFYHPLEETANALKKIICNTDPDLEITRGELIFPKEDFNITSDRVIKLREKIIKVHKEKVEIENTLLAEKIQKLDAYAQRKWGVGSSKSGVYNSIKSFVPSNKEQLRNKIISLLHATSTPRKMTFYTAKYGNTESFKELVSIIQASDALKNILRGHETDEDFTINEAINLLQDYDRNLIYGSLIAFTSEENEGLYSIRSCQLN